VVHVFIAKRDVTLHAELCKW